MTTPSHRTYNLPVSAMPPSSSTRGFTLVELLLVIAVIGILASIVIVAINPSKQLGDARNVQRKSDINTIINALYQYVLDHQGSFPSDVTSLAVATPKEICRSDPQYHAGCATLLNLAVLTGSYVTAIPRDPSVAASSQGTAYVLTKDLFGRITIAAPQAEDKASVSVSR